MTLEPATYFTYEQSQISPKSSPQQSEVIIGCRPTYLNITVIVSTIMELWSRSQVMCPWYCTVGNFTLYYDFNKLCNFDNEAFQVGQPCSPSLLVVLPDWLVTERLRRADLPVKIQRRHSRSPAVEIQKPTTTYNYRGAPTGCSVSHWMSSNWSVITVPSTSEIGPNQLPIGVTTALPRPTHEPAGLAKICRWKSNSLWYRNNNFSKRISSLDFLNNYVVHY